MRAPALRNNCVYARYADSQRACNAPLAHRMLSVRKVASDVLVRWASLTALAHGPAASHKHGSPATAMVWPAGLNTYVSSAVPQRICNGGVKRSLSTTLIGRPLCSDNVLPASTARLIERSPP